MCASKFHHVVVVGVEKWAVAANLICPAEISDKVMFALEFALEYVSLCIQICI